MDFAKFVTHPLLMLGELTQHVGEGCEVSRSPNSHSTGRTLGLRSRRFSRDWSCFDSGAGFAVDGFTGGCLPTGRLMGAASAE